MDWCSFHCCALCSAQAVFYPTITVLNGTRSELLVLKSHWYHPPAGRAPPEVALTKAISLLSSCWGRSHKAWWHRDSLLGFAFAVLVEFAQPSPSSGSSPGTQKKLHNCLLHTRLWELRLPRDVCNSQESSLQENAERCGVSIGFPTGDVTLLLQIVTKIWHIWWPRALFPLQHDRSTKRA